MVLNIITIASVLSLVIVIIGLIRGDWKIYVPGQLLAVAAFTALQFYILHMP